MPVLDYPINNASPMGGSVKWMMDDDRVRRFQPFLDARGRAVITQHPEAVGDRPEFTRNDSTGGEKRRLLRNYLAIDLLNRGINLPLGNAASLTKDAWIQLDQRITLAAKPPLVAWDDLARMNPYGGFDAYRKTTVEWHAASQAGRAYVDMNLETEGTTDQQVVDIRSIPLPCTHADFTFWDRELEVSRGSPMPYDTGMAEEAAARVSEEVEDTTVGSVTGFTYGTRSTGTYAHLMNSTIFGYANFTDRLTKTNFTAPSGGGWVPDTAYNEFLAAIQQLGAQYFYGPFMLYYSNDWDQYMHRVYSVSGGNTPGETLISMLQKHTAIAGVKRLPRLSSTFTIFLVQMTGSAAPDAINGRGITTIEWVEKGGLKHCWKVYVIQAPRLKSDYNRRCGILHGTTA